MSAELDLPRLVEGVLHDDRATLARALTLVESNLRRHQEKAQQLLTELLPYTGRAMRVGITGVPGVGKSTFIDALGCRLVAAGRRVAVLAVDPSSERSGGSILGDKTRMSRLGREPNAFIRPSPSGGALGGVARKTRESILVCEAAGFDCVLVETVGVGQSEIEVGHMVDFFLVLMLPNAGDELQGIKRGIVELADLIAINKADGDQLQSAELARQHYEMALRYLRPVREEWTPEVRCVSSVTGAGLDELWERIEAHRAALEKTGALRDLRAEQAVRWMWHAVEDELRQRVRGHPDVDAIRGRLEREVREGRMPATLAATRILEKFGIQV